MYASQPRNAVLTVELTKPVKQDRKMMRDDSHLYQVILSHNCLCMHVCMYVSTNFLQIKGCAMETKCAPTSANIFTGILRKHTFIH